MKLILHFYSTEKDFSELITRKEDTLLFWSLSLREIFNISVVPKDSICFVQYSFITIKRRKTAVNEDSSAF